MSDQSRREMFELASRMDELCDEFETQWASGTQPAIEDFLLQVAEAERQTLFRDLLVAELELLGREGQVADESSYSQRFPEFASVVAEVFVESGNAAVLGQLREYELQEKLGEGGMGVVYRAVHSRLKRTVAIKTLPPEKLDRPEVVARFHREMEAIGQLDNPHIVRAHDAGEADGTHFLVMEFVDGLDLRDLQERTGPLSIANACEIVRQAALGLQSAADAGLVHRDIKPANLMVTKSGTVKILDLGLAQITTESEITERPELTTTGQIMGTFDYLAPEQATDTKNVDTRADIYGLGCTLFKLLTGKAPYSFEGSATPFQRIRAHLEDPIPSVGDSRTDVPEELDALLTRMLAKLPVDRITPPAVVAEEIAKFCAGHDLPTLLKSAEGQPVAEADTASVAGQTVPYVSAVVSRASVSSVEPEAESAPQKQSVPAEKLESPPTASDGEAKRRRVLPIVVALSLAFGLLAYLSPMIFSVKTDGGTIVLECDPAALQGAKVEIDGEEVQLTLAGDDQPVTIGVDKRRGQLRITKAGFKVFDKDFEIILGDSAHAIQVRLEPLQDSSSESGAAMTASSDAAWLPGPKDGVLNGLIPRPAELAGIKRWQIETRIPRTHVRSVDVSPDGRFVACGCNSGLVRVYDAQTLEMVELIHGDVDEVKAVAWSPDGKWLAFDDLYAICLWSPVDGTTKRIEKDVRGARKISWSPESSHLATAGGQVRIVDVNTGNVATLSRQDLNLSYVDWSPDGDWIAAGGYENVDGQPGAVLIWDVGNQKTVATGQAGGRINDLMWHPDSHQFATAHDEPGNAVIRIWSKNGELQDTRRGQDDGAHVNALTWSPNGKWLAAAGTWKVKLIDLQDDSQSIVVPIVGPASAISWDQTRDHIVTAHANGVHRWSLGGLKPASLPGSISRNSEGPKLKWSHDSSYLAVILLGRTDRNDVRILAADGGSRQSLPASGRRRFAWHPQRPVLAVMSDAPAEHLVGFDVHRPSRPSVLTGNLTESSTVAWSPDGEVMAVGHSSDGAIEIWELQGNRLALSSGHDSGPVLEISWSPDSKQFASAGNGGVTVWNADGSEFFQIGDLGDSNVVAWSPTGEWIARNGNGVQLFEPDGTAGPSLGDSFNTRTVAWSPDGERLVGGNVDRETRVWSKDGQPLASLKGHKNSVSSVDWSSDGKHFASTAQDCTVIVWDAETYEPVWTGIELFDGSWASFTAAGQTIDGDPDLLDKHFVYVVENEDGSREVLRHSEFMIRIKR